MRESNIIIIGGGLAGLTAVIVGTVLTIKHFNKK